MNTDKKVTLKAEEILADKKRDNTLYREFVESNINTQFTTVNYKDTNNVFQLKNEQDEVSEWIFAIQDLDCPEGWDILDEKELEEILTDIIIKKEK